MRRIEATFDDVTVVGLGDTTLSLTIEVEGGYSRPTFDDPGDYPEATVVAVRVSDEDGVLHEVPQPVWHLVLGATAERHVCEACAEQAVADAIAEADAEVYYQEGPW